MARRSGGPRLSDQISDRIEARILDCEFEPGTRLPGQRELARILHVDRRTVGQAYRRLASNGLVRATARSVPVVSGPDSARTPADLLFAALVKALRTGLSGAALGDAVEVWSAAIGERRLAVKCSEPVLAAHVRAELAAALPGVSFVGGAEPGTNPEFGLPVVVPLGDDPSGADLPCGGGAPDGFDFQGVSPIRLHLGLSRPARTALLGLQGGQIVAAVSRSPAARRIVRRAVSTLPEAVLGFAEADSQDENATVRALALSEVVLGDVHPKLIQRAGFRGRHLPLKLVTPISVQAIRARLGVRPGGSPRVPPEPCSATMERL